MTSQSVIPVHTWQEDCKFEVNIKNETLSQKEKKEEP